MKQAEKKDEHFRLLDKKTKNAEILTNMEDSSILIFTEINQVYFLLQAAVAVALQKSSKKQFVSGKSGGILFDRFDSIYCIFSASC